MFSIISETLLPKYIDNSILDNNGTYQNKGYQQFLQYLSMQTEMCPLVDENLKNQVQTYAGVGRDMYVNTLRDLEINATGTFSFDMEVNPNTSAKQKLTVNTAFSSFTYNPTDYIGNTIGREKGFANQMRAAQEGILKAIRTNQLAFLSTKKTQVWDVTSVMNSGLTFGSSTLSATDAAQRDNMISQLEVMFAENGFDGRGIIGIASGGFNGVVNEYKKYGEGNDKNLLRQLEDYPDFNYILSNSFPHTGKRWAGYFSRKGAHGTMFTLPAVYQLGEDERKGGATAFYQADGNLPLLGNIPVGFVEIASNVDDSDSTRQNLSIARKVGMVVQWCNITNDIEDRTTESSDILYIEGATS